jgi:PAS domain-containing protein
MDPAQKPLELILARNLLTSLSTPAFLVDSSGALLFYNEAAGSLLGMSFEDAGKMDASDWGPSFGPFDDDGNPIHFEDLPTTKALRAGRPAHTVHRIRSLRGDDYQVEVSALPIVGEDHQTGAIVFFWPAGQASDGANRER